MAYKVLVVDDSSFFRRRVKEILNSNPQLQVIDTAVNGEEAIEKACALKPDVITMDIEMPVLDGISAVREIMKRAPTPVLMFSSLTYKGAQETLKALDAGAVDFLPKKFEEIAKDRDEATALLQKRVLSIVSSSVPRQAMVTSTVKTQYPPKKETPLNTQSEKQASPVTRGISQSETRSQFQTIDKSNRNIQSAPNTRSVSNFRASGKRYKLTAIGTSTGGPIALQRVLSQLPRHYPHPIVLIQHMPGTFTSAFAERLNSLCNIDVKEAVNGDILKPGVAYLAPGGYQMMLEGSRTCAKLKIFDAGDKLTYKPSVDITFGSAAKIFGAETLSIILTGMGSDGCDGARLIQQSGGTVWAQDKASCVVYGMPQAVTVAGVSSESLALDKIAERLVVELGLQPKG
ncbi:chemotaxis response regulator protein-glutamate methylesterase [Vibrio sp.]|nr:chemotaxis response regulator protein-glutamate methylesterase [Vibrio sp.]